MNISSISSVDFHTVQKILSANHITDADKVKFIRNNSVRQAVEQYISSKDFSCLMKSRPLQVFKPLKNSFTKRGDKILLAKALGILPSELNDYIENVYQNINKVESIEGLSRETVNKIETYIYRHGSVDQVVSFLNYELKNAKDITKEVYKTLEYNNEKVADYFARPIHHMSHNTLIKIYNTVDKNLEECRNSGKISEKDKQQTTEWALIQLYKIKENQKLKNAIKTYKKLSEVY